jgi:hypothetical protein
MTTIRDRVDQVITDAFKKSFENHLLVSVLCHDLNKIICGEMEPKRFAILAAEAGWRLAEIADKRVVCRKQPAFLQSNEILELLEKGREKLAEAQRLNAEKEAAEREREAKLEEQRHNGIMALVPEALHPYVSIENNDFLHIQIPGAARVSAKVYLSESYWEGNVQFEKALLACWQRAKSGVDGIWRLFRYYAHDGEVDWYEEAGDLYIELDTALARAVELGDRLSDAEAEADKQRAEYSAWKEKNVVKPDDKAPAYGIETCPLMSMTGVLRPCLQHPCAWFVAYKGMDACSLKVLANKAADGMEVE